MGNISGSNAIKYESFEDLDENVLFLPLAKEKVLTFDRFYPR